MGKQFTHMAIPGPWAPRVALGPTWGPGPHICHFLQDNNQQDLQPISIFATHLYSPRWVAPESLRASFQQPILFGSGHIQNLSSTHIQFKHNY
jgi:hypothetical protein